LAFGGRVSWFCKGSGIVFVPASNEIFHNITLVLAPDNTTNSRDSADPQVFGFRSSISELLLDGWCIRFLQQLNAIKAPFVQNFNENRLVSYICIALPASTIWIRSAYSVP
jgi:hypothetical protein